MSSQHPISEEYFLAIAEMPEKLQDAAVMLLSNGLPPIPVVPQQLNNGYDPIHGKAPSYFYKGKPRLLKHQQLGLHGRISTPQEMIQWFSHPDIGIGTFGKGNLYWMDFDRKHFDTQEECDRAVEKWRVKNNICDAWRERTGGGGYRVLVEFECIPDFTNFSLIPNGKHVGEIKGHGGFVVLDPSLHPSGNHYEYISGETPGKLYSAEFAGLYPVKNPSKVVAKNSKPEGSKQQQTTQKVKASEPFEVPKEWLEWDDLEQAEYIGSHPNCKWRFDSYQEWLNFGIVLFNIDENKGLQVWEELSKSSSKYIPGECAKKWESFYKGDSGMGSIIHWAKEDGLIFPSFKGNRTAFRKSVGFKNWVKMNEFTPDKNEDQEQLNISEFVSSSENQVICVKSGLGTGKTHDSAKYRNKRNRGTRELYPINDLALNTIERVSSLTGKPHYHLRFDDDGRKFLADSNSSIHSCFDSLRKYFASHFYGVDTYLDEAVAGLAHVANGETLGAAQASIIRKLNAGFSDCESIFLMDGNLRDLECDLVAKKSGKKVLKILNTSKPPRRKATFITGIQLNEEGEEKKDASDITAICSLMISKLKTEHKLWVGTDSKAFSKRFFELLTEDKSLKDFGFRVLVINSENSKEDWAKEFKKNPQKWLEESPHDIVIISPSCAYGLDVQNPIINGKAWFTEQYYIYRGVVGTFPQIQQMRRLRDNDVPTFVFCPERSTLSRDGILGKAFTAQEYLKAMNKVLADAAQSGSLAITNPDIFYQKIGEAMQEVDKDWLDYSIKLQVIDNFEKENLKECLIYSLEQANYEIEEVDIKACGETKVMLDEAKKRTNGIDATKVFNAKEIDEQAYEALKQQAERTDEERAIITKYELLKRLPGIKENSIFSVDFIKRQVIEENNKLIEGLELFIALNNTDKAKKALGISFISTFANDDGEQSFKSSLMPLRQIKKSKFHQRVIALNELGIPDLVDELLNERELTKNDSDLIEIVAKWKESYSYKLGIYPEKPQEKKGKVVENSEVIPSIKRLLSLIAFPIMQGKKKKIDGKRVMPYVVCGEALADDERRIIERCIIEREEQKLIEINAKFEEKNQQLSVESELELSIESEFADVVKNHHGEELVKVIMEKYIGDDGRFTITGKMVSLLSPEEKVKFTSISIGKADVTEAKNDNVFALLQTCKTPEDIIQVGLLKTNDTGYLKDLAFQKTMHGYNERDRLLEMIKGVNSLLEKQLVC